MTDKLNLPADTPILSMNSPTFAEDFRKVLGIKEGEILQVFGPQFDRTNGVTPTDPPATLEEWAALPGKTEPELRAMGFGLWDDPYPQLWLLPAEWYSGIPDGLVLHCIDGSTEIFKAGATDNDRRFGCLAFGFLRPEPK